MSLLWLLSLESVLTISVYGSPTDYAPRLADALREALSVDQDLVAAVYFDDWNICREKPSILHATGDLGLEASAMQKVHRYTDVSCSGFIVPGHPNFKISTAGVAHTRSLAFFKQYLDGPHFDLEKIWDEHTYFEFGVRSVGETMATMVQEPYVNHVPTV